MSADQYKDDDRMPWGKYKGRQLGDTPASYLLWFGDQEWRDQHPKLLEYVEQNREALEQELSEIKERIR